MSQVILDTEQAVRNFQHDLYQLGIELEQEPLETTLASIFSMIDDPDRAESASGKINNFYNGLTQLHEELFLVDYGRELSRPENLAAMVAAMMDFGMSILEAVRHHRLIDNPRWGAGFPFIFFELMGFNCILHAMPPVDDVPCHGEYRMSQQEMSETIRAGVRAYCDTIDRDRFYGHAYHMTA